MLSDLIHKNSCSRYLWNVFLKNNRPQQLAEQLLSKYKYGKYPPVDVFKIVKSEVVEIYGCDFNDADSMHIRG